MAPPEPGISASDKEFLAQFEACSLPESEWTHLAHIRVAWACLNLAAAEDALDRIRAGIQRYNTEVLKRPQQYHETVTVAYSRLVSARMRAGESWNEFELRIADLLDRNSPILLRYYSEDRLFCVDARQAFVDPDIEPLPDLTVAV